jgi:integrase
MAQKIFVSKARVVKGAKWYLDYTRLDVSTGKETRHRRDFDLNDIENEEVRAQVAQILCRYLDSFIAMTPAVSPHPAIPAGDTVQQAVTAMLQVKMTSPRKNTHRGYKSISKTFLEWARAKHLATSPVSEFSKKNARAFFDWLNENRTFRAATTNNYLIHLRALWFEMLSREMVEKNPWSGIKPARKEEKLRRIFTDVERRVVATEVERTDYWMFRALLLQYYCYIRPAEMIRLRFKNFDLGRGVVCIEEAQAKKWKKRYATLPASVLHYFRDGRFEQYPANYFVFGLEDGVGRPSPTTPVGDNRLYKRHKAVLHRLKESGALGDITGLTWYSWKDTGISRHTAQTSAIGTRDQAGHDDVATTMIYYHTNEVNEEYRALPNDLA